MRQEKKENILGAFAISAILSVITVVALTVFGELYAPLKDGLKNVFTHHWVGKGVISFVGFYIVGIILAQTKIGRGRAVKLLSMLAWISLFGAATIIVFYFYEAFLVTH
jgi:hypothetical protein